MEYHMFNLFLVAWSVLFLAVMTKFMAGVKR